MSQDPPNPQPADPPTSDPSPPHAEPAPPVDPTTSAPAWGYPGQKSRRASLAPYLEANRGRFTDEALAARATEAGYTQDEIDGAMEQLRRVEAAHPVRKRARRVVLAAYVVTYAVLVAGMLLNQSIAGSAPVGIVILTVALAVMLAVALLLIGRARPRPEAQLAFAGVLAIPLILLVIVAGICVVSGVPIPRAASDAGPGFAAIGSELPPVPAES